MQGILGKFSHVVTEPGKFITGWKQDTGRKVVGCAPMHVPEELIHAAGMLPVIMWESNEPISAANAYVQSNMCGYGRSVLDNALKGKLDFLDGWIFLDCCMTPRGMAFFIERHLKPSFLWTIYMPILLDEKQTMGQVSRELLHLKTKLESLSGKEITLESISQSISVYNRNRDLLRQLYELRRNRPGIISAKEMLMAVQSSMIMPKEMHNKLMEDLLTELATRTYDDFRGVARVVLSGSMCQAPPLNVLDLIENSGVLVIDDDLYVGSRYIITDADLKGDPIDALAARYLNMGRHCPTKSSTENDWGAQLVEVVKSSGAQGVISILVKFCEPHYFYYPDMIRILAEARIPELKLEVEHEATDTGLAQVKNRVQAFVESITGD